MLPETQLIESLVGELRPVRPLLKFRLRFLLWTVTCLVVLSLFYLIVSKLRPTLVSDLFHLRYAIESTVLILSPFLVGYHVFALSIPGASNPFTRNVALFAITSVCCVLLLDLAFPPLIPSMVGKAPHCYLDVILGGLLPLILGLIWLSKTFPLKPLSMGIYLGCSVGLASASFMGFFCMYDPLHNILWHFLPSLLLIPVGTLVKLFKFE